MYLTISLNKITTIISLRQMTLIDTAFMVFGDQPVIAKSQKLREVTLMIHNFKLSRSINQMVVLTVIVLDIEVSMSMVIVLQSHQRKGEAMFYLIISSTIRDSIALRMTICSATGYSSYYMCDWLDFALCDWPISRYDRQIKHISLVASFFSSEDHIKKPLNMNISHPCTQFSGLLTIMRWFRSRP